MPCDDKYKCVPAAMIWRSFLQKHHFYILAGKLTAAAKLVMQDIWLPKFDEQWQIEEQIVLIFDADSYWFDIILSMSFLCLVGIDILYSKGIVNRFGNTISFCDSSNLNQNHFKEMIELYSIADEEFSPWKYICHRNFWCQIQKINTKDVIKVQMHLRIKQKEDLNQVFDQHSILLNGTSGIYLHRNVHIDLKDCTVPFSKYIEQPSKRNWIISAKLKFSRDVQWQSGNLCHLSFQTQYQSLLIILICRN